jgi:hypothetical protein
MTQFDQLDKTKLLADITLLSRRKDILIAGNQPAYFALVVRSVSRMSSEAFYT